MGPRHPYFVRHPKGQVDVQERDERTFDLLYEYRFLDTQMLGLLLDHQGSDWALQSRLRRLFDHAYIDRPAKQLVLLVAGESEHGVHALGRKGAQILAERRGLTLAPRRWTQKNNEVGDIHLQHVLGVNRFRICLRLAMPRSAPREGAADCSHRYFLPWIQEEELKIKVLLPDKSGQEHPWTLAPDGFFGIQHPQPPPNRSYFFLEYERGNPGFRRFVRAKCFAYRAYRKSRVHEEHLGIKGFRVLVITQTRRKMDTLRRYIRQALSKESHPPWALWLFTSEDHYNLEKPESVLKPIWVTANDDRPLSLVEQVRR